MSAAGAALSLTGEGGPGDKQRGGGPRGEVANESQSGLSRPCRS